MAATTDGVGWTRANIYTLAILTIIYAINMVDRQIIGLMIPLIKADMQISDTVLGLISGFAFAIFYAIAALPAGSLADRWSRRTIVAWGLAAWSVIMLLHGAARNAVQLAAARLFLGIGEATSVPASNSMIADLFRPAQRAFALGFQSAAASVGVLVAYPLIGYVSGHLGWRAGFMTAGLPGILVAVLFYLTVREPRRGQSDARPPAKAVTIGAALRRLAATPGFVLVVLTGAFTGFAMAIMLTWLPTFLSRVHGLSQGEIGNAIGMLRGTGGVIGALAGGWMASWLGRRGWRWRYRVPAFAMILVAPAEVLLLFGGDIGWRAGLMLETILAMAQFGPMFALLLAVSDSRTRSVATACFILAVNIVGQGGGPLVAGAISDLLTPALGSDAIRFALLTAPVATILAGICCLLGGRRASGLRLD